MKKLKKVLALVLACLVLVGASVAGTLAWLTAKTGDVVNTFTVGDIDLELTEHKLVKPDDDKLSETETTPSNAYNFVPGDSRPKDPWVTVKSGSEACYVFIHVTETNNKLPKSEDEKIINFEIDDTNWKAVNGHPGYYYHDKITTKVDADKTLNILKNKKVTVNENVTKDMVDDITKDQPTLTFTAAAVQMENLPDATGNQTAIDVAWSKLPGDFTGTTP